MSTLNTEALRMPSPMFREGRAALSKRVAAVRLVKQENGSAKLGAITQLDPGFVDLCGPGYNERTVKVRLKEECYFVFKEDLGGMLG